jgi:ATP-dependent protease ClpP protease subunit
MSGSSLSNQYLNTIGGAFSDGLPIYNLIAQHPAHVTVKVMGYALSIGSVIMLAADSIEIAENGLVMIHRAQGFTYGDASDHTKTAQVLQTHENAVIPDYMSKLGKTDKQVRDLLQAETWYTAAEAKAAGLVDVITGQVDTSAAIDKAGATGEGRKIINAYKCKPGQLCTLAKGNYS